MKNNQPSLRPHDVVVALKLMLLKGNTFTYASLGHALNLSASEVHGAVSRARVARLVTADNEPQKSAIYEFIVHGVLFAFPALRGDLTQGMPTAYAGPVMSSLLIRSEEPPPVWPHPYGKASKGIALFPLYPGAPSASERDLRLYELLSLIDSIRIGGARERALAASALEEKLS